ncbi:MAG: hypothetical protein J0M17_15600, partial [Planctomycetes bacterium]|nr:hypothetical protein [Planctomycetota bacterium]
SLIYLLTPQHTGTHFTRMLLETHPEISLGVAESRRIDCNMRPDYCPSGNGHGPHGAANERMLDDFAVRCLRGELEPVEFVRRVAYCLRQRSHAPPPRSFAEQLAATARHDFGLLGLELPAKSPRYLLFHGHAGPKLRGVEFGACPFRFVVTLRHPLLAVVSALRRTNDPQVAENLLQAFDLVLDIPTAAYVCVDHPQCLPEAVERLFAGLNLTPHEVTRRYLSAAPAVNRTISRERRPNSLEELESAAVDPTALAALAEARAWLLEGQGIHPLLDRWAARAAELKLPERMARFGYRC